MKTTYMEIVNGNYIGSVENPVDLNEILKKADKEGLAGLYGSWSVRSGGGTEGCGTDDKIYL